MIIDHVGIVVATLEDGIKQWQTLFGYRQQSEIVVNTRQQVRVAFLGKPDSLTVKLIEPSSSSSPISSLAKRGGGLHHICFKCDNIEDQIPKLESGGARVVVRPQPGEAFNGHDIAMLLARNNLAVELIDTSEKYGWISPSA